MVPHTIFPCHTVYLFYRIDGPHTRGSDRRHHHYRQVSCCNIFCNSFPKRLNVNSVPGPGSYIPDASATHARQPCCLQKRVMAFLRNIYYRSPVVACQSLFSETRHQARQCNKQGSMVCLSSGICEGTVNRAGFIPELPAELPDDMAFSFDSKRRV